jgi:hypothetical protein
MPVALPNLPQPETRTQMFISGVEMSSSSDTRIHARIYHPRANNSGSLKSIQALGSGLDQRQYWR